MRILAREKKPSILLWKNNFVQQVLNIPEKLLRSKGISDYS